VPRAGPDREAIAGAPGERGQAVETVPRAREPGAEPAGLRRRGLAGLRGVALVGQPVAPERAVLGGVSSGSAQGRRTVPSRSKLRRADSKLTSTGRPFWSSAPGSAPAGAAPGLDGTHAAWASGSVASSSQKRRRRTS
jgi:hypothetical protein